MLTNIYCCITQLYWHPMVGIISKLGNGPELNNSMSQLVPVVGAMIHISTFIVLQINVMDGQMDSVML